VQLGGSYNAIRATYALVFPNITKHYIFILVQANNQKGDKHSGCIDSRSQSDCVRSRDTGTPHKQVGGGRGSINGRDDEVCRQDAIHSDSERPRCSDGDRRLTCIHNREPASRLEESRGSGRGGNGTRQENIPLEI
jgi:hypothetical protein